MKFAVLALLGLVTVNAVTLRTLKQRNGVEIADETTMPATNTTMPEENKGEREMPEGTMPEGDMPPMPSADEMIAMCDQDGDAKVSLEESHACIDAEVPEDYRREAHDMVDEHFAKTAGEDNLVDAAELEAAMNQEEP